MTTVIRRVNYAKPIGTKTRTFVLLPENLSAFNHIVKLKESVPNCIALESCIEIQSFIPSNFAACPEIPSTYFKYPSYTP